MKTHLTASVSFSLSSFIQRVKNVFGMVIDIKQETGKAFFPSQVIPSNINLEKIQHKKFQQKKKQGNS